MMDEDGMCGARPAGFAIYEGAPVTATSWRRRLCWLVLAFALAAGRGPAGEQAVPVRACADGPAATEQFITSLKQLKQLNEHQLEQLYAQAEVAAPPVGYARGQILILTETRHPKVAARLIGLVWKGKYFDECGCFINQWPGFRALRSRAAYGPSWYDGRPSLVLEYPEGTPLFANTRDEVRAIGPGLYLSRLYDRCPPRFRGFVGLQLEPERGCKRH
jgi:hypothetical protein